MLKSGAVTVSAGDIKALQLRVENRKIRDDVKEIFSAGTEDESFSNRIEQIATKIEKDYNFLSNH